MKEQARLCKLQLLNEKRVEWERRQEMRRKELAAKLAERQHQKTLCDAEKAIQLSQKGKRKCRTVRCGYCRWKIRRIYVLYCL
jgi:hypothetical protein